MYCSKCTPDGCELSNRLKLFSRRSYLARQRNARLFCRCSGLRAGQLWLCCGDGLVSRGIRLLEAGFGKGEAKSTTLVFLTLEDNTAALGDDHLFGHK